MNKNNNRITLFCFATLLSTSAHAQWLEWGGPSRNFKVAASQLASEWPAGGPKQLWKRVLGDGYSTIIVEDSRLYTMYRESGEERVVCLHRDSGKTAWEYSLRIALSPENGLGMNGHDSCSTENETADGDEKGNHVMHG